MPDCLNPQYRSFFDEKFYIGQFRRDRSGLDLFQHFIDNAKTIGLAPSRAFDTLFYLETNNDVANAGIDPLDHFLAYGRNEGRSATASGEQLQTRTENEQIVGRFMDVEHYYRQVPALTQYHIDPVQHYLAIGNRNNLQASPLFDEAAYVARNTDVDFSSVKPLLHYLKRGRYEGRSDGTGRLKTPYFETLKAILPYFDAPYYIETNKDLDCALVDPARHYLHFGWLEGRDPSAAFSTSFYLARYGDVRASGEHPLLHYARGGELRGRLPKWPSLLPQGEHDWEKSAVVAKLVEAHFDTDFYLAKYRDIRQNGLDPIAHYIMAGWREGRAPNNWFNSDFYMRRYTDATVSSINPLVHYLVYGKERGFEPAMSKGALRTLQSRQSMPFVRHLEFLIAPERTAAVAPLPEQGLNIDWIIPDFRVGGGGHMTIFRMVYLLELLGHTCTIWVVDPFPDMTPERREATLINFYQPLRAKIKLLDWNDEMSFGDVVVATGWNTANLLSKIETTAQKFYFVQDYEPMFFPQGSFAMSAEETYALDLKCICASPWLKSKVDSFGGEAAVIDLAVDPIYRAISSESKPSVPRIAFYAREHTARRAVELAVLGLQVLHARGMEFEVDLFGNDGSWTQTPFPARSWGVIDAQALSDIYHQAIVGICFSATNYSLVPQEMMACGLAVLDLDVESTRAIYPDGVVAFAKPRPDDIADKLAMLLTQSVERNRQTAAATQWVSRFRWELSAEKFEAALLATCGRLIISPPSTQVVRASVVVPTYNGGAMFEKVLACLLDQAAPWCFEIVAVDSGSTDGTWEVLKNHPDPRLKALRIEKEEFQHGRTRNYAIAQSQGEYIAVITQDALPSSQRWLYNFVNLLDRFPEAAGAFGRHVAHEDATAYTVRDIKRHFEPFRERLKVTRYDDVERYRSAEQGYRSMLHYLSDNNACLRRSVWEKIPYREVDYGEDQLWARDIVDAGYAKLYAYHSDVMHSHDYNEIDTFERARTEAEFFLKHFGYDLAPANQRSEILAINADDESWGIANGLAPAEINQRKLNNAYRIAGLCAGSIKGLKYGVKF